MKKIKGGFYIKARCIAESAIATAPPHIREIWDYFIQQAFWMQGKSLGRGQLLTSYREIQEALSWYVGFRKERYKKHHCEAAMKYLTKHDMIQTTRTTRGLIVTICNYGVYQDVASYENYTIADTRTTRERQCTDTIDEEREEGEEGKKEKTPPKSPKGDMEPVGFSAFWKAYPRKTAKQDALKRWNKNKCEPMSTVIIESIAAHLKSEEWKKDDGQFIPYPATYLNQGRWEDVLPDTATMKKPLYRSSLLSAGK